MTGAGRAGTVGAVLLALALGACSAPADDPYVPPPLAPRTPAPVSSGWPGCQAVGAFTDPGGGVPPAPWGSVPNGFVPQRAVLCQTTTRDDPAGSSAGTRTVRLERTATDLAPLLTYLARPDEPPVDGACSADAWLPPWLFLVDAQGRYLRPAIPVDGCEKPLGWYEDRDRMPWLTLAYTDRER